MRFLELAPATSNIGDEIQVVASSALLPHVDGTVKRDGLNAYDGPPAAVVMSGWFSHVPENWPPARSLTPIFLGFHMTERAAEVYARHADYFRRFEPIGCRDKWTERRFASWGVPAYTSYCATLTFPRRERAPEVGKVVVVDAGDVHLPRALRRTAIGFSHEMVPFDHHSRMAFARRLLEFYRDEVSLVITTRLHAALPCAAMGIPVVFFGDPGDPRTSILDDLRIPVHNIKLHRKARMGLPGRFLDRVDWSPSPPEVNAVAQAFRDDLRSRIERLSGA